MAMNVEKFMADIGAKHTVYRGHPWRPYLGDIPSLSTYRVRRTPTGASIPLHEVNGAYVPAPPRSFHGISGYYPPTALSRTDTLPADEPMGSPQALGPQPTLIVDESGKPINSSQAHVPSTASRQRTPLTRVPTLIVDENDKPAVASTHPSMLGGGRQPKPLTAVPTEIVEDNDSSPVVKPQRRGLPKPLARVPTLIVDDNEDNSGGKTKAQAGKRKPLIRVPTEPNELTRVPTEPNMEIANVRVVKPMPRAGLRRPLARVPALLFNEDDGMEVDSTNVNTHSTPSQLATPTIIIPTRYALVPVPTYVSDDEDMDVDNDNDTDKANSNVLGTQPQSLLALTRGTKRRASSSEDLNVPHIPAALTESLFKRRRLDSVSQNDDVDETEVAHVPQEEQKRSIGPLGPYRHPMDPKRFRMSLKGQFFVRLVALKRKPEEPVAKFHFKYVTRAPPCYLTVNQSYALRMQRALRDRKNADAARNLIESGRRAFELSGPRRRLLVREGFVDQHKMPRTQRLVRWKSGLDLPSLDELKARRDE